MAKAKAFPVEGGCPCKFVRYRMTTRPLFVHCCHCTWCQRETGSAFAMNAMIEQNRIKVLSGQIDLVKTPSQSGKGQLIARCPRCHVAVWSHYAGAGTKVGFVRVGTLDRPDVCPPDIHVFTGSKQRWVQIPKDARAVSIYYRREKEWPASSIKRLEALKSAAHE